MSKVLVTGSKSGLGLAIATALRAAGHHVWDYDLKDGLDVRSPNLAGIDELDVLINNAGINGISMLEDVTDELWNEVLDTNTMGIMKMSRACLPMLQKSKGTIVNIVSRSATTPMTASICYNASKGAGLIMTKQMARELTRRWGITVFSVSPNKLAGTEMSRAIDEEVCRTRGWTMEEARKYQLTNNLVGEETPPEQIAELLAFLLQDKEHHRFLTGVDLPYGHQ
jgi:3-oxoacyl-[acyl-carrier protein] reductase